jgi:hypothetical protein
MRTQLSVSTVRAENFQPQLARRIIRLLLSAGTSLAVAFTFSCSSDDGGGSGGYGRDQSGSTGGNGKVIIVVNYRK